MGQQLLLKVFFFFFKAYTSGAAAAELGWGEAANQYTSTAHQIKITKSS